MGEGRRREQGREAHQARRRPRAACRAERADSHAELNRAVVGRGERTWRLEAGGASREGVHPRVSALAGEDLARNLSRYANICEIIRERRL